jgi:aspartate racemase
MQHDLANDRVLGVLGGMGPLASAHFMTRLTLLTPATRDQEHIPAVLWSDPRIPDRSRGRLGGGPDPLPALLRGVRGLRQAGCGAIAIPCNTAHGWYEDMAAEGLPILHIVDATADAIRRVAPSGRIGIMGTAATLAMRLYHDRLEHQGWTCIQPDEADMRDLVLPAIAAVKANRVTDAYAPLAEAATRLADRGAAAVVLGCTEIPLGIQAGPWQTLNIALVDSIDALALAAIGWSRAPAGGGGRLTQVSRALPGPAGSHARLRATGQAPGP